MTIFDIASKSMLFYIRRWDEQLTKEQVDTENSKKDIY